MPLCEASHKGMLHLSIALGIKVIKRVRGKSNEENSEKLIAEDYHLVSYQDVKKARSSCFRINPEM